MSIIVMTRKAGFSLLVVAGMCGSLPAGQVRAEPVGASTAASGRIAVKSVAGKGAARFDWLAKRGPATPATVTRASGTPALGSGSWICSPAGFGSKSRCHQR